MSASSGRPEELVLGGDSEERVNIIDKADDEIRAAADPLWRDLLKSSNEGAAHRSC